MVLWQCDRRSWIADPVSIYSHAKHEADQNVVNSCQVKCGEMYRYADQGGWGCVERQLAANVPLSVVAGMKQWVEQIISVSNKKINLDYQFV